MLVFLFLCGMAVSAQAVEPQEILTDPRLEEQAQEISRGIRCPVCQGQSIDESAALLAKSLRIYIRSALKRGQSSDQIAQQLKRRYGDEVLMNTPWENRTIFLWALPIFFCLAIALFLRSSHSR